MRNLSLLAVVALAALAACNKTNPTFCEGTDEECADIDGPIDSPPSTCSPNGPNPACEPEDPVCVDGRCTGQCTTSNDCAGRPPGELVCDPASGDCGACAGADEQDGENCPDAGTAVCDAMSHTCRACRAHSECDAGVCDDGRCTPAAEILHLDHDTGSDGNNCGSAEPCATLNRAIDAVQDAPGSFTVILMAPDADSQYLARGTNGTADFNNVDVLVIGTGATVTRTGAGPTVEIKGGANVRIEGLTIIGGNGGGGYGIDVSAASTLELFKATVTGNGNRGISAAGNSTLDIRRSRITMNQGGGIFVDTGKITLINNVIAGNGNGLSSIFGGLNLNLTENPNVIEFNSIISNAALAGSTDGMICLNNTVVARNNIIVGNATSPQTSGTCTHTYTLFTPTGPTGEGNMNIPALDIGMYAFTPDQHIGPSSVAIGKAADVPLTGELAFDIDDEPRPRGTATRADVGADEAP